MKTDFSASENKLIDAWQKAGYYKRTEGFGKNANKTYTVVIPPPNITGALHMGHALNDTLQDACVRRARMQGFQTRWVMGTDHAGIATQTKVDKKLAEDGVSRLVVGREKFIDACYDWYKEYGTRIVTQIRAMGASCDFDDEHFTLEPEYVKAVRTLFVDWYNEGLIYKGKRIVNWCPCCTTAIADDEAEYIEESGHLWHLRYPLVKPLDGIEYITVATTRPETMLGDTGVAISPKDPRYAHLIGAKVLLPLVNREIEIFADYHVDPEFGTGFVKVTPAHDPNDYAMGNRHDLERINIFDEKAVVVKGYGDFSGMNRDEVRVAVVEAFDKLGLLDKVEDHHHSVMTCYRCHTKLEPWLSEQWFVAVEKLKQGASNAVRSGEVKFYPQRWSNVYLDWLENLKDWCISRQLWWGHRIPIYYCDTCSTTNAYVEDIAHCPKCQGSLRQDEDVLDTWFSSQLWPFATMGWQEKGTLSPELELAYPTQMLSTARDIMGLWVARMVMSSLYCTGKVPFNDVVIHPTVMAADGKPMSKSRGNGIDPLRLMQDYGADGMRFGLLMQVTGAQDLKFNEDKLESSRNFANKVRNAARFVQMNLDDYTHGDPVLETQADRWIFSRLAKLVKNVDEAYANYEFGDVTRELYNFFWSEFCDWYIEFSKGRLNGEAHERQNCQRNLVYILDVALRMLHPIMPFVTEEIYQKLPVNKDSEYLIGASWPDFDKLEKFIDDKSENNIKMVCDVVSGVRSIRARYSISPKEPLRVSLSGNSDTIQMAKSQESLFKDMAKLSQMDFVSTDSASQIAKPKNSSVIIVENLEVYVLLEGIVDFSKEKEKLEAQLVKLSADFAKFDKKLSNPGFLAKASPEIVEKDKAIHASLAESIEKTKTSIEELSI